VRKCKRSSTLRAIAARPAEDSKAPRAPKQEGRTGLWRRTKEGLTAINRKFSDPAAWAKRREKQAPPPGGWPKPPAHWPPGVRVDIGRPVSWLPEDWGQGVKTTCVSKLLAYVSPEGKVYYHKHMVEQACGRKLASRGADVAGVWAKRWAQTMIAEGKNFHRKPIVFKQDEKLFVELTKAEFRHLPKSADALHFAVVSARRADSEQGLRSIVNVQAQLLAGGAKPTWYVDAASLDSYKKLGLNAKVGGKLVPARNLALKDAQRLGKPCVQVSDDIYSWTLYGGPAGRALGLVKKGDLSGGNVAAKRAKRLRISPAAAARYLLARMRAARDGAGKNAGPRLAGVFPLGNTGQAFCDTPTATDRFILGDFFVADSSPCRFDPRMTLKEDYDFTCSHLAKHGQVFRCNRMFVAAVHEVNQGGAVSERDSAGKRERENIVILKEKWPGVFHLNGRRGDTQVIMSWKRRKLS